MVRFITRNLLTTCAAALVAAVLVFSMAAPAAAGEWPNGYQQGRDDNFMRVAEPPLYVAGVILDWVVYRPVHAVMTATKGETHAFAGYRFGGTEAKVRRILNRAESGRWGRHSSRRR